MGRTRDRVVGALERAQTKLERGASRVGARVQRLYGQSQSMAAIPARSSSRRALHEGSVPKVPGILFMCQVLYNYPLGPGSVLRRSRKCLLIVSGAEVVLLKVPSTLSQAVSAVTGGGGGGSAAGREEAHDRSAMVMAVFELHALRRMQTQGRTLRLEFATLVPGQKVPPSVFSMYGTTLEEMREVMASVAFEDEDYIERQSSLESAGDFPPGQFLDDFPDPLSPPAASAASALERRATPPLPGLHHHHSHLRASAGPGEGPAQARLLSMPSMRGMVGAPPPRAPDPRFGSAASFNARTNPLLGEKAPLLAAGGTEEVILTFRDEAHREQACTVLDAAAGNACVARPYIQRGFPLSCDFEIASITSMNHRIAGPELTVCGPAIWGLELELPSSWAEAVAFSSVEEFHPHPLDVGDAPQAVRIYMATPAGMAVATLLPELVALFAQQTSSTSCELLAVPVLVNLSQLHQQQEQQQQQRQQLKQQQEQEQEQEQHEQQQQQQQELPQGDADMGAAHVGIARGVSPPHGERQETNDAGGGDGGAGLAGGDGGAGLAAAPAERAAAALGANTGTSSSNTATAGPSSAAAAAEAATAAARVHVSPFARHSRALSWQSPRAPSAAAAAQPLAGGLSRSGSEVTSTPSGVPPRSPAPQEGSVHGSDAASERTSHPLDRSAHSRHRLGRTGSGDSLRGEWPRPTPQAWGGSHAATPTSTAHGSPWDGGFVSDGTATPTKPSSAPSVLEGSQQSQDGLQVEFGQEVYAVIYMKVLRGRVPAHSVSRRVHFSSSAGLATPVSDPPAAPPDGASAPPPEPAPAAPSNGALVLKLSGSRRRHVPRATVGAACAVGAAVAAALLALALAGRPLLALQLLLLAANAATLLVLLLLGVFGEGPASEVQHAVEVCLPDLLGAAAPALAPPPHLRLQLRGGGFVRAPMGLLEQQAIMVRALFAGTGEVDVDRAGAGAGAAAADCVECGAEGTEADTRVLVSSPEPEWVTPDMKLRFTRARPHAFPECQMLARLYDDFWRKNEVATILQRPPRHFAWFQEQLGTTFLGVSPQGHAVLRIMLGNLGSLSRPLREAGLQPEDVTRHFALLWTFMFTVLAPQAHPAGRYVLLADMRGLRMGQAMGSDGNAMGRALGTVMTANPERLAKMLVVNAPSWFNLVWKVVAPHLAESTRAKMQVLTDASSATSELGHWLGAELVPAEYGGPCALPLDRYPAQRQLLDLVRKLHAAAGE